MKRPGLHTIQDALLKLFDVCLARPKTTVITTIVLTAALGSLVPGMKTELRIYDLFEPSFPSTTDLEKMKKDFDDSNSSILIVAPKDPTAKALTRGQACLIQSFVERERDINPEISDAVSPFGLRKPVTDEHHLWYPKVLKLDCFGADARSDAPLDLSVLVNSPWRGTVTSRSGNDIAIEFTYRDTPGGSRFGRFNPVPIGETYKRAEKTLGDPSTGLRVYISGRSAIQWHTQLAMKRDNVANLVIIFLVVLFFRLLYGTWRLGILFSVVTGMAVLIVFGSMSLLGISLDMITANLFMMLAVAGLEDILFIVSVQRIAPERWREAFRNVSVPGFFTSMTTAVGFASLSSSQVAVIGKFGTAAAFASMVEWALTFLFLPALCSCIGERFGAGLVNPAKTRSVGFWKKMQSWAPPRWLGWASLAAFPLGILGFYAINFEDHLSKDFPKDHLASQSYRYSSASRNWEGMFYVVFEDGRRENEVKAVIERLSHDENVAQIDSPYGFAEFMKRGLPPLRADLVGREIKVTRAYERVFANDYSARAALFLKNFDLSQIKRMVEVVQKTCAESGTKFCHPAGEAVVFAEISGQVMHTLVDSFGISILIVALILLAISGGFTWRTRISVLASAFWGPVAMLGLMALFQIPVNIISSMFAAVLVGLTGDNAIQYLFAAREQRNPQGQLDLSYGVAVRGSASIELGVILALASLTFCFLTLLPLKILGLLFFLGFGVTLIGDLWLLKGLLKD